MSYSYPKNFSEEGRISYVINFANWLNREASNSDCNNFSPSGWRLKDIKTHKDTLQKCREYWPEYIRERALEYKTEHKRKCDRKSRNDY